MKIIKTAGAVLAAVIIVPLLVAAILPKEYTVKRSTVIERSAEEVFSYIKMLKNQDNYSVWARMDPDMKRDFRGTDGTVGFVSAWESEKDDVGKGEQEIKKIDEGKRIDTELRFIEPFESISDAYMTTEQLADGKTRVVWGFHGRMSYPMNLMMLFMDFDGMIGKDFETGLADLKKILEAEKTNP